MYCVKRFLSLFGDDQYAAQEMEHRILSAVTRNMLSEPVARFAFEGSASDMDRQAYWEWITEQAAQMLQEIEDSKWL